LIDTARCAREKAYAPYSGYKVGAAVLCKSENIYSGFNVENAAYTPTTHAEELAILLALKGGEPRGIKILLKPWWLFTRATPCPVESVAR
jgi:cytidine deaminase